MTPDLDPILSALAHVEAHLCDKLTIQDLADTSGYSLFHFTRLFNQFVGLTPYDYLIRRRLSDASEVLLKSDKRIIDIAQDYQFGSHEAFTRAFNRLFAMPPSQWREQGAKNKNWLLPPLGEEYLFVLNEVIDRKPKVIAQASLRFLGWTLPKGNEENAADLWQSLGQFVPDYDPAQRWIIQLITEKNRFPDFQFIGIKSDLKPNSAHLLTSYDVEAGEYLKVLLNQKGQLSHVSSVLIFLYHALIPRIKYTVVSPIIFIHFTEQIEVFVPIEPMGKMMNNPKAAIQTR